MLRINVEGGAKGRIKRGERGEFASALLHHGWTHSSPPRNSATYIYSGVLVYIHVGDIRLQIHIGPCVLSILTSSSESLLPPKYLHIGFSLFPRDIGEGFDQFFCFNVSESNFKTKKNPKHFNAAKEHNCGSLFVCW